MRAKLATTLIPLFFFCFCFCFSLQAKEVRVQPVKKLVGTKDSVRDYKVASCSKESKDFFVTKNTRLNPNCIYRDGFVIKESNTTLDCRGAVIKWTPSSKRNQGVMIGRDRAGKILKNVTVRNCQIQDFYLNIQIKAFETQAIRRLADQYIFDPDQMTLPGYVPSEEFNYKIINNSIYNSKGAGVFVRPFIKDVLIKDNRIAGAGGVGIYLGAYSKNSKIVGNKIYANGFNGSLRPGGVVEAKKYGVSVKVYYTGREGIAVDASQYNTIARNTIHGNAAGGIFLYKNTSEKKEINPQTWFERKLGAFENRIENNIITSDSNAQQPVGIWIGARMSQNTSTLYGSDPIYYQKAICMYRLFFGSCVYKKPFWAQEDSAKSNTIRNNDFRNFFTGIRIEDDENLIENNKFSQMNAKLFHASFSRSIVVQTNLRGKHLNKPVRNNTIRENRTIVNNSFLPKGIPYSPYQKENSQFRATKNSLNGKRVGFLEDHYRYNVGPFLFALKVNVDGYGIL